MKYTFKFGRMMGLGDTLWLTPIYKAIKNSQTYFEKSDQSERLSFLFDNLTEYKLEEKHFFENQNHLDYIFNNYSKMPKEYFLALRGYDQIHHCRKIFHIMGINEDQYNIVPEISLSEEYLQKGKELLLKLGNPHNPIIFVSNNAAGLFAGEDERNWQAAYRTIPPQILQIIINELSKRYTILHCGIKGRVFNFDNVIKVFDYIDDKDSIKTMAGLYKIVGRYLGIDTGDAHLMVAVGGETKVLIPDRAPFYNAVSSVFREEEFRNEKIRAEYVNFNQWQKILEKDKLSF